MRNKAVFRIVLMALCLPVLFFILRSSVSAKNDSPQKESLEACQKPAGGGKMIWENLSRQFFSSY